MTTRTPQELLKFVADNNIQLIDLRFQDFVGQLQHVTRPSSEFELSVFKNGFGFDGSSIRGWQAINESDMLLLPDSNMAFVDPFFKDPTLVLYCTILDPITLQPYSRDPRAVAQKCEAYIRSTGIADTVYMGPEAEFFIFDHVAFGQDSHSAMYNIDSEEGIWNSTRQGDGKPNLGFRPRYKEGYFPVPPLDSQQDIRSEMCLTMMKLGIEIEAHHHEVATAGQAEIDMRFGPLVRMADQMTIYKYVVRNVAAKYGKSACFMPKPLFGDNGSGMHVHSSLWKNGKPLFAGDRYAGLSEMCLHYIGGVLKHAPALLAFCAPTTNSYKRLVPGYEAPVNLAYSQRNRSASCRIPMYSPSPKAKRLEFRCPDPSANPYYCFAAIAMAGMDGILNKIDPGQPFDKDLYDLEPEELAKVPKVPGSLEGAINALEADHKFLLKGDVFTQDVIDTWISYKRIKEIDPMRMRPHPYEFFLYYDL